MRVDVKWLPCPMSNAGLQAIQTADWHAGYAQYGIVCQCEGGGDGGDGEVCHSMLWRRSIWDCMAIIWRCEGGGDGGDGEGRSAVARVERSGGMSILGRFSHTTALFRPF
jgi:hypothetical protein